MGRKVVFSAFVAAGLMQMAPAFAQERDPQPDREEAPAAAPAPAPAETLPAPAAAPVAEARRAAAPPVAEAAPPPVMDRARELAEKDLAAVPPEEQKPVLVDPGDARRALARARRAAAEAQEGVEPAPRAAVAAAEPAPRPVYADEERAPAYPEEERETRREVAAGDDAAPYPDDEREAPVARDLRARQARQIYADDRPEPAAAPRDLPARSPRPVYADDDRDARPAYPDAYPEPGRYPADDIDARAPRPGDRYAIVDRSLRPDAGRGDAEDQQWGARNADPICAGDRAGRLLNNVRRKADYERIDGRAAEDLEDEIGHAADLERSYCQSGMNDWREQRLDRLYAQIEDRIRYEEDRRWRR